MAQEQNFRNHARIVPAFHIGVLLTLLINIIWSIYRLTAGVTGDAIVQLLVAVALFVMAVTLRAMALTVQDRVIRLEMRLRLARVLPPPQQAAILQLSPKQLVALRFAGDSELPTLVQRVIGGELGTQKAIKSEVKEWQPDLLRA